MFEESAGRSICRRRRAGERRIQARCRACRPTGGGSSIGPLRGVGLRSTYVRAY